MDNLYRNQAINLLNQGGVIIFPTDTVWGIGASLESNQGIKKLYQIKGRDKTKPTAVLVADIHMANRYGSFNKKAWQLAKKHWPGALTLVVKAKGNKVPSIVTTNHTVGLRVPDHQLVQELCRQLDAGLVASSANLAGKKPPRNKADIDPQLINQVDLVLEGKSGHLPASTVVDLTQETIKILRPGPIKI